MRPRVLVAAAAAALLCGIAAVLWLRNGDREAAARPRLLVPPAPRVLVSETETESRPAEAIPVAASAERVLGIWSGTVRTARGEAVAGRGTVRLRPRGKRGLRSFHFDDAGAFSDAVEPAAYAVEIELADGRRFEVGEVVVPELDLVEDLTLPAGTRIVGRVLGAGDAGDLPAGLRVSIRPEGHDRSAASHGIRVHPDGTFFFDALAPGRYRVAAWPSKIAGTAEGFLLLDVPEGLPEITLDLEVQPR